MRKADILNLWKFLLGTRKRTAAEVGRRVMVLAAMLELSEEDEATSASLREWVCREGLERYMTGDELYYLQATDWDPLDVVVVSWQIEACEMLLWALHKIEQPPAYVIDLNKKLGLPTYRTARDFLKDLRLRPAEQLQQQRELARLWAWRARQRYFDPEDVAKALQKAGQPPADDLFYEGQPLNDVHPKVRGQLESLAEERLRALDWLCDPQRNWDYSSSSRPFLST